MMWLYIVILWPDFYPPSPVPYESQRACEQAKAEFLATQSRIRTKEFMASMIVKCSSERP